MRLGVLGMALLMSGCLSLGSDKKGEYHAALDRELAEMLKSYRLCLQKYEEAGAEAKRKCEAYREALHDLAPKTLSDRLERVFERDRES
jgi:hypothetical protein